MKSKQAWTIKTFIVCSVSNGILAGLILFMADKIVDGLNEWVSPFLKSGAPDLPVEVRSALSGLGNFLTELRTYMAPVLVSITSAITFLLWFCISLLGRRQIDRTEAKPACSQVDVRN